MPFGLKNVGAAYKHLVNLMFKNQIGRNMEVYMNYFLIKSTTHEQHLTDFAKPSQCPDNTRYSSTQQNVPLALGGGNSCTSWSQSGKQNLTQRRWKPYSIWLHHGMLTRYEDLGYPNPPSIRDPQAVFPQPTTSQPTWMWGNIESLLISIPACDLVGPSTWGQGFRKPVHYTWRTF